MFPERNPETLDNEKKERNVIHDDFIAIMDILVPS